MIAIGLEHAEDNAGGYPFVKIKSIQIALPKETSTYENRIGLTPQAVQLLVANGHEVILEKGAGERAGFSDADYLLAGASVTEDLQQVWQGGLILKINAPTLEEVGRMMPGQSFVSCASKNQLSGELLDEINRKQLIVIVTGKQIGRASCRERV